MKNPDSSSKEQRVRNLRMTGFPLWSQRSACDRIKRPSADLCGSISYLKKKWRVALGREEKSSLCMPGRSSGNLDRRLDVSYRGNLLPLSYAQRAHKFKGRATYMKKPDSS